MQAWRGVSSDTSLRASSTPDTSVTNGTLNWLQMICDDREVTLWGSVTSKNAGDVTVNVATGIGSILHDPNRIFPVFTTSSGDNANSKVVNVGGGRIAIIIQNNVPAGREYYFNVTYTYAHLDR